MGKKKEKAATTEAERGEPRRVEGLQDSGTTEETAAEDTATTEETAVEEPEPKETGLIVGRRDLIGPAQQLPVEEIEFEHLLSSSEFANAPRIVFVDGDDQKVLIDRVNAPEAEK